MKKMNCGAKSIQDCLNCPYPDCIEGSAAPTEFETDAERIAWKRTPISEITRIKKNRARREYYSQHREEEIKRAKKWNTEHRDDIRSYNRLWMNAYREKQREVTA